MPKYPNLRAYVDTIPRRVTQQQIADSLGIPVYSLSKYLHGFPPERTIALRLSRQFGIALEGLLDPPVPEAAPTP